ncbi:hypothetical protein FRB94_005756 [Tulasnella sp. JGI-2019a]|nr:hypothetical protein FRB94_005756 [Tulasnella sp. JGI-2019a]
MASYTYELKLKLNDFKPPKDAHEEVAFGNIGDFWEKYDKLAEKFDQDMTARLNDNLDALLVFAGLFSAVNTSFIILALAGLSSGPSDQTNHLLRLLLTNGTNSGLTSSDLDLPTFVPGRAIVRQNCLFVASLGFSLIAAAGAVLARQWLQYYERTGQTGPVRQQAIRRTEKYLGAESWGLAHVVEALPTLLIISIALFAAGLVDYLWDVDATVALVVLVYIAIGFLAYGFTVIAGAVSRSCPFQTSLSMFFRNLYMDTMSASHRDQYVDGAKELLADAAGTFRRRHELRRRAKTRGRKLLRQIGDELNRVWNRGLRVVLDAFPAAGRFIRDTVVFTIPNAFKRAWSRIWRILSLQKRKPRDNHIDKIYTHSAIWMAETAPDNDNMLTIAQNIPFISDFESMQLIAPRNAFRLLLLRFSSSLLALHDDPTPDRMASAVTMAKAVAHVALAAPVLTADGMCAVFLKFGNLTWLLNLPSSLESEELMTHLLAISSVFYWTRSQPPPERLTAVEGTLREGLHRSSRKGQAASTYLHHCILMAPINARKWNDTQRQIDEINTTLSIKGVKVDVAYVSCAARVLSLMIRESTTLHGHPPITPPLPLERAKSAWIIRTENSLADGLLDVLEAFSSLYSEPPESIYSPLLLCQRQLLVHGRTLHGSNDQILRQSRQADPLFFQKLHSALNSNIQLLFGIQREVFQPSIDSSIFTDCQDQLVDFLNHILLTPASQWYDVVPSELETTALWAQGLGSKSRKLSQGILYRYFVHVQYTLPGWTSTDRRDARLASDGRVGRVLSTSLRLYSALCPSVAADKRWPVFQTYLRSMATGHVQLGGFAIGLIPTVTTPDAGLHGSDTPTIGAAFNIRRPSTLSSAENDSLVREVERVALEADRKWDPEDTEATGSCLIWLAESIRIREAWVSQVDGGRVVQLFVTMMRKRGKAAEDTPDDTNIWSNADVKAAGALFLVAWEAQTGLSDDPSASRSDIKECDTSGWMAEDTIEAFTTWLQTFEKHGVISIKEKDDNDIVFIQTTVGLALVHSYIERANADNKPAVERFGLNEANERLMRGQIQTAVQETRAKVKVLRAFHPSPSPAERLRAAVAKTRPPPIPLTQSSHVLPLHISDDIAQAEGSTHVSEKDHEIGT